MNEEGLQLSAINITQNQWKDQWVCEQLLTGGVGSLRPEVLLQANLFDQSWPTVSILIHVKNNCITRFRIVGMLGVTRCPIKPNYFIHYYNWVIQLFSPSQLASVKMMSMHYIRDLKQQQRKAGQQKQDDDKPEVIFSQRAIVRMSYSS